MNKEKQIEEMAKVIEDGCANIECNEKCKYYNDEPYICYTKRCAEKILNLGYRKIDKDSIVLSREEYDELVNLQQTHSEELTNAIQSYEEDKADLKINYDNHIKNLEKIIDRQSKDLNSQANRLIDLKAEVRKREDFITELTVENAELQKQVDELKEHLKSVQSACQSKNAKIKNLNAEKEALQNELNFQNEKPQ